MRSGLLVLLAACTLQGQGLKILSPTLQQFEDGPALRPPSYMDGERVYVSFLVDGYRSNEERRILLEWKAEARDEAGLLLAPAGGGKVDEQLQPEDKDWKPKVRYEFETPQTAYCEACQLTLTVADRYGKTEAKVVVPFRVETRRVAPSETVAIRNFRFLRSEEDTKPLATAAYRPGDDLWARFEMTGYQFGEKNRAQVEYGLSVFRPSGKLLYEEPKAAVHDETSFYPRKWVSGVLSLKLDRQLPPGEYSIVVDVRDVLGGQQAQERVTFRIE